MAASYLKALELMKTPLSIVDSLAERKSGVYALHLGMSDVPIAQWLDYLRDHPQNVPRTGHLGNWPAIAQATAGALDFNHAICEKGYGYPLIYGFTQTEAAADGDRFGDWNYLPGSLIQEGKRRELALYTWDGAAFVARDRQKPRFCPFVQVASETGLVPLSTWHWARMQKIPGWHFTLEADLVLAHERETTTLLSELLAAASFTPSPQRALQDLISHVVTLDGLITRTKIRREGTGYWLDTTFYESAHALANAAMVPFLALSRPNEFFADIRAMPDRLPVLSHVLMSVLTAKFTQPPADAMKALFNLHLHWGARAMAGVPPRQRGYFFERSTLKSLKHIMGILTQSDFEFAPIFFAILPAAIFMLCPTSVHPNDAELLTHLFRRVCEGRPAGLERLTLEWLADHRRELSSYFLGRFQPGAGIPFGGEPIMSATTIEPERFRDLTVKEACGLVAVLMQDAARKDVLWRSVGH